MTETATASEALHQTLINLFDNEVREYIKFEATAEAGATFVVRLQPGEKLIKKATFWMRPGEVELTSGRYIVGLVGYEPATGRLGAMRHGQLGIMASGKLARVNGRCFRAVAVA